MTWRLAYVWWLLWGFGRWLKRATDTYWVSPEEYWRSGRRTSWWPLKCGRCHWRGPERWTEHGYKPAGLRGDEVEIQNYCPACRAEI